MMEIAKIIFYAFAAIAVLGAFGVLVSKKILYAALCLMGSFLGIAGLFVFAQADFLAVAQLMVYVGGVIVLLVFGIMLSKRKSNDEQVTSGFHRVIPGILVSGGIAAVLGYVFLNTKFGMFNWLKMRRPHMDEDQMIAHLGDSFMSRHLLSFELAGLILLVALIAAAFIAAGLKGGQEE